MMEEDETVNNSESNLWYVPVSYVTKQVLKKLYLRDELLREELLISKLNAKYCEKQHIKETDTHALNVGNAAPEYRCKNKKQTSLNENHMKDKATLLIELNRKLKKAMNISKHCDTFNLEENKVANKTRNGKYTLKHSGRAFTFPFDKSSKYINSDLQLPEHNNNAISNTYLSSEDVEFFDWQIVNESKLSSNICNSQLSNERFHSSISVESLESRITCCTITSGYLSDNDLLSDDSEIYGKYNTKITMNQKSRSKTSNEANVKERYKIKSHSLYQNNKNLIASQKRFKSSGSVGNLYITSPSPPPLQKTAKSLLNFINKKKKKVLKT